MNFEWGDKPIRYPLAFLFVAMLAAAVGGVLGAVPSGPGAVLNALGIAAVLSIFMLPYVVLRYRDGAWPARAVARLRRGGRLAGRSES